jgi:hypothetical protein
MRDLPSLAASNYRATRRAVTVAVAVGLAGCAGGESDGDGSGDDGTDGGGSNGDATTAAGTTTPTAGDGSGSTATPTSTSTPTPVGAETATDGGLDLREANVTAVEVSESGSGGNYRFDVTLYHDDDGEDGYANWWDVETRDGERLGRRELLHPHGTREFTRSTTVEIPDDVDCVVVRGHDETHGFGGRAMLVNHRTGATRAVDQGPDRASIADEDCP